MDMPDIRNNYLSVLAGIRDAAEKCGRDPDDVKLIAVSKTKPVEYAAEAMKAGAEDFGENRPQELVKKYEVLPNVRWHQIGTLQKNKVRHIVGKAALIHSVDSRALLDEIEKRAAAADVVQDILIQVNITGEETKSGIAPDGLSELVEAARNCAHVELKGLMTISKADYTPEQNREVFSQLRRLADKYGLKELSMGMTHDYEDAVRCGATYVRVGTAIFGARDYTK